LSHQTKTEIKTISYGEGLVNTTGTKRVRNIKDLELKPLKIVARNFKGLQEKLKPSGAKENAEEGARKRPVFCLCRRAYWPPLEHETKRRLSAALALARVLAFDRSAASSDRST
jgi:hypothetical protein